MTTTSTPSTSTPGTTPIPDASREEVARAVSRARAVFDSGVTRPLAARERHVRSIGRMLTQNRALFEEALRADLHKSCLLYTSPSPRDA